MEEQEIKKALAPAQWEDLKAALEGECSGMQKSSPVKLAIEPDGDYEISATNLGNGKAVFLRYDPGVPCIHVKVPGKEDHIGFRVAPDGLSVQLMDGQIPRDAGEITVNLVRRIL